MSIQAVTHPEYDLMCADWEKFRLTYKGGKDFREKYLKVLSSREDSTDFSNRKEMTYVPAHAKAALNDVKNAIFQRMSDINRKGGPVSYQMAIAGENGGVDYSSNTMNGFIGRLVLSEMLSMGRVGVYVDKHQLGQVESKATEREIRPYIYVYPVEDIRSWVYDKENRLIAVLLRDHDYTLNADFGLVGGSAERYRLLRLIDKGVEVTFYDLEGKQEGEPFVIGLRQIPFTIFDIGASLLTDVADYQIALLNIASSDVSYAIKSNFPFYTEQFHSNADLATRQADASTSSSTPGTSFEAQIARDKEIKIGVTKGRRYARGLERPGYINPSAEPLRVSMEKQEQMKQEIRQLINLAITNIEPRRASAEAKSFDERGLEAGLSYIGLELEYGERKIAEIWAQYENRARPDVPTIHYPRKYSLRTEVEARAEAKELTEQASKVSSITFKKEVMKEVADLVIGTKVPQSALDKIYDEIMKSQVPITDAGIIFDDVEQGILSKEAAASAKGYPAGDVAKAESEHVRRAETIALAQSKAAARGVADLDSDPGKNARQDKKGVK